ncbi:MAG: esterase-like activity of phytase family protein [Rhodobacteraceae bacterium]|nr:esterase-like activity of phytase family protein [Paracoccaceae bacterium]
MRFGSTLGLIAAGLLGAAAPAWPDRMRAELVGRYIWTDASPIFGGISGLELTPDGLGFVAVSDSGTVFEGRFLRGAEGQVTGTETGAPVVLLSHHGKPLSEPTRDAEGIALATDGSLFISFETRNHIGHYSADGTNWIAEDWPEAFKAFAENLGAEALAIDGTGRLIVLPEVPPKGGNTPVYRRTGERWEVPFTLRRDGHWNPVGADFGPDGRLYLLERDFWPLLGFASRVRRLTLSDTAIQSDEVIWQSEPGWHDNLEGIAVWQDPAGAVRLTLVADDNFLPVQKTEVVDLKLTE